jgi:uncharacterized protein YndB with AHSA1/START domain
MARTTRVMDCRPEDVFAVLADGWLYGMWVVGSARIRNVDENWPEPGSRIHHSVGAWPFLVSDDSQVEDVDAPRRLQLRVKAWPAGEARAVLTCTPTGDGKTEVTMEERAINGPAAKIPQPLQKYMLHARNIETLRRLSFLAENGAGKPR